MTIAYLSETELAALDELEDMLARGEAVVWDEPKTIRGIVVRDVETVTFNDKNNGGAEKSKRVLTLRTTDGLVAIFEGPAKLTSRLFNGERFGSDPVGPPVQGQLAIVTYKGERVSQTTGRDYKDFDVVVGPPPAAAGVPPDKPDSADAYFDAIADGEAERADGNGELEHAA